MRPTSRLLALATEVGPAKTFGRSTPMALLPPIPLYRRILRTHRKKLGHEERVLGDLYVKAEFRAHREVENPVQIVSNRYEDLKVENLCTCWKIWIISYLLFAIDKALWANDAY